MNSRILNIIRRFALVIAVLGSFIVGCGKNVKPVPQVSLVDLASQLDLDALQLYREAAELYRAGNYKNAAEKFTDLIDKFPNSHERDAAIIRIVLSTIKLTESEENKAKRDKIYDGLNRQFSQFAVQFPKSKDLVDKLRKYTSIVHLRKELREANKVLNKRLPGIVFTKHSPREYRRDLTEFWTDKDSPDPPYSELRGEVQFLIAQLFLDEHNYAQAYQAFDKVATEEFRDYPNLQADAMYHAAFCLKQLGVYDEALGRYTDFMMRFPKNKNITKAYFDVGEIYADISGDWYDYHSALQNFDFALQSTEDPVRRAAIRVDIGQTHYNERKYKEAFDNYKLVLQEYPSNIRAKFFIAILHFNLENWDDSIDWHKRVIKEYDETRDGGLLTYLISEEPKYPSLIAASVYEIGRANYRLALRHQDAGEEEDARKNLREALKWYKKLITEKGFKDDDVLETLKEKDFRIDALAPVVLHQAMLVLDTLKELGELGSDGELELYKILDVSLRELSEPGIEGVLKHITDKYISNIRDDHPLLAAEVQLKFAHVKRDKFKQYDDAAEEYKKLWTDYFPSPDLRLNLLKLQGKYYEGLCYEQKGKPDKSEEAHQQALTLFKTTFQPLIDHPNIDPSHINKNVFDYCIQTANEYAEKINDKLKEAEQKSEDNTDKESDSSDAAGNLDSSKESQAEELLTAEEIAEIASGSTVYIETEIPNSKGGIGFGSGLCIGPGLIATNYHVISGKVRGTVRLVGTNRKYAIIGYTAIDPDHDLAILKVRAFGMKPLPLGDSEKVKQGHSIYPVGNPLGLVNVVSYGQISSFQWVENIGEFFSDKPNNKPVLVSDVPRGDTPHKLFMMTAPTSGGNSGGPVINGQGKVIGISVGRMESQQQRSYPIIDKNGKRIMPERYVKVLDHQVENLNFAVPVNYLKRLLKRTGPPKPLSDLEIVD